MKYDLEIDLGHNQFPTILSKEQSSKLSSNQIRIRERERERPVARYGQGICERFHLREHDVLRE